MTDIHLYIYIGALFDYIFGMIEKQANNWDALLAAKPNSQFVEKWGDAAALGFSQIPDVLFTSQDKLGIDVTEMVVLLNVLSYWWYDERKPFPKSSTIAQRTGLSPRTVQRALRKLEQKEIVKKTKSDWGYRMFDPAPLVEKLSVLARRSPKFPERGVSKLMT